MLMLLSPSKTLDFHGPRHEAYSQPEMLDQTAILARKMKRFSSRSLQKLLDISENLGDLNHQRYQEFELPLTPETARQALMAFKGDSYHHFELDRFTEEDWSFAQRHLRILSGLYGVLRPMDLIRPYRLEMGTALKTPRGARLTDFWGDRITEALNAALAELDPPHLLNLASQQYFDAVRPRALKASIRSHSENRCRWIRRRFWSQVASDVREWAQRPMTEQPNLSGSPTRRAGTRASDSSQGALLRGTDCHSRRYRRHAWGQKIRGNKAYIFRMASHPRRVPGAQGGHLEDHLVLCQACPWRHGTLRHPEPDRRRGGHQGLRPRRIPLRHRTLHPRHLRVLERSGDLNEDYLHRG